MASSLIQISIDSARKSTDCVAESNACWAEKAQLPLAELIIPDSPESPTAIHFSSPETKSTLSKIHATKFWTKPFTKQTLYPIVRFPVLPFLLPVSKIYLALQPNYQHNLVENSLNLIKNIQHAYEEVQRLSTLPQAAKATVEKTKDTVLYDMLNYTLNTLARLFVRTSDSDLVLETLCQEMYYVTINIIRVFEFSILDLLGLPEIHQSPLVTVLESSVKKWHDSIAFDFALQQSTLSEFATSYKQAYNKGWEASDFEGPSYPSTPLQRKHYEFAKEMVQNRIFNCCNLEGCNNFESKVRDYAKCARCKWMRYCSQSCQLTHWKAKHKFECAKPLTAEDVEANFQQSRIIIGAEGDVPAPAEGASTSESAPTSTKQ